MITTMPLLHDERDPKLAAADSTMTMIMMTMQEVLLGLLLAMLLDVDATRETEDEMTTILTMTDHRLLANVASLGSRTSSMDLG